MEIEISGYKVLIDDEDWEKVKQYSWRVCKKEEYTRELQGEQKTEN